MKMASGATQGLCRGRSKIARMPVAGMEPRGVEIFPGS
jgi:hypothetical protein